MPYILILGANGQLARNTIPFFLKHPDVQLTLYLRRANRLKNPDPNRVTIVDGDVLDGETLKAAMQGQDIVYASLAGEMEQQAKTMKSTTRPRKKVIHSKVMTPRSTAYPILS